MPDLFRPFVVGYDALHRVWTRARRASGPFDHAVRSWQRFDDARGARAAAYMSYLGVLSLFPIIALAFAAAALLIANVPSVGRSFNELLEAALRSFLPGLSLDAGSTAVFDDLQRATTERLGLQSGGQVTAVAGVLVLLYTGSGWVSAQREALRTVFNEDPRYDRFFLIAKAHDIGVLLLLGVLLAVSVAASVLTQRGRLAALLGIDGTAGSTRVVAGAATVLLGVLTGVLLFLAQHKTLTAVRGRGWDDYLPGALVAAVGFEVLKQGATLIIDRLTTNAVSGTFAAIIAVLIWINLTSRVTLLGAAWTVTGWEAVPTDAATTSAVLAATPGSDGRGPAGTGVAGPSAAPGPPTAGGPVRGTPAPGPTGPGSLVPARRTPVSSTVSVGLAVLATAVALSGVVRLRSRR